MLPYWFLFVIPAFGALNERTTYRGNATHKSFIGVILLLSVMIGLRFEVGGDWDAYLRYLDRSRYLSFFEVLTQGDPGYILVNWLATRTVDTIWFVNLVCGLFFSVGLVAFAKAQPRPWLALLVAIPYLVIVVAMGYSRQAVAIGFAMLGLVALTRDRSNIKFVIWVALAATFHKTALLLVPIAALSAARGRVWTACWIGVSTVLLYYLFLEDSVDRLIYGYIEREYNSQGAAIRVTMNALPAIIFLLARRRFYLSYNERRLWTNIAFLALAFIGFLIVSPSSTVVDRMALYFIPLQIFVLSRLPDAFPEKESNIGLIGVSVILYSAAIQFVWLNFAANSHAWLPYQFYPLLGE
ncbi:MAG TPA: EpsG family protein [Bellilinea sp.]|nr:EpsG family protein [Bellilinea sp.]